MAGRKFELTENTLSIIEKIGGHKSTQDVFQLADALMYEEKNLLKTLGAVTRDDESDKAHETGTNI